MVKAGCRVKLIRFTEGRLDCVCGAIVFEGAFLLATGQDVEPRRLRDREMVAAFAEHLRSGRLAAARSLLGRHHRIAAGLSRPSAASPGASGG